MDLFWMGFPFNASLCWFSSPCPWPRPWIQSRLGFSDTERWPLLLQDGWTAEYQCYHVVQCVQKRWGAREIKHFLVQTEKNDFWAKWIAFFSQVKHFFHMSSWVKKFPRWWTVSCLEPSDKNVFFTGENHVSRQVKTFFRGETFLLEVKLFSCVETSEKLFSLVKLCFPCVKASEKTFLCVMSVKKAFLMSETLSLCFKVIEEVSFVMCQAKWKSFIFLCWDEYKTFFSHMKHSLFMCWADLKSFFLWKKNVLIEMSEKVSLMNQLFLIYYEASEKMSLSWVKLFFFMCQTEWKLFFHRWNTLFHASSRVKKRIFSCVKLSEKVFFFFFFICRIEWKCFFVHVSSQVKKVFTQVIFFFFFVSSRVKKTGENQPVSSFN